MKIGIIGAMELEVATLKEVMEIKSRSQKAGMEFFDGILSGVSVVVVKCGVGKVNAALCVQILADCFEVTHVINTGIAGSLNKGLDIGDILVSEKAIQHDMDVTIFGYKPGQVPGFESREFIADAAMAQAAVGACQLANPDIHIVKGCVVSGDQFISDDKVKQHLINEFKGDCAEMEGASVAQAASLNNLPFVIIRAISDKADGSANMDYPTFERKAAEHCANMVKEFLKIWKLAN